MSKNKYIAHQPLSTKIYVQFVMYADKVWFQDNISY